MRCQETYPTAWFRYPIELGDKRAHVGHVLDDVVADDFVKVAVSEGIGDVSEVMDDVGVRVGIVVHADGAGVLVAPTSHVEDPFARSDRSRGRFPRSTH